MTSKFDSVRTKDANLQALQESAKATADEVSGCPLIDGRLIESIVIVLGTPKVVQHGLGRKLKGWLMVRKSAGASIWDSQSTNALATKSLVLNASANVTVSLWVF